MTPAFGFGPGWVGFPTVVDTPNGEAPQTLNPAAHNTLDVQEAGGDAEVPRPKKQGYLSNDQEQVYLLHFARPIGTGPRGQAQHYIGRTKALEQRLTQHRTGTGARLPAAFLREGIPFQLARMFKLVPGQRGFELERSLKNKKHASRLCPICQGEEVE